MLELIDSHCHIDAPEFDADRDVVIERARAAGVTRQVVPAVARGGFAKLRDICASTSGLFPAYGLHPMFLAEHRESDLAELEEWIDREKPVAVGECGLDFYVEGLDETTQRSFFDAQLRLARDAELPVIVHARRAVDDVTAAIRRIGTASGVVHSFAGSMQQAGNLWDLGFLLGIGGPVTYERATKLRGVVAKMPLEYLLLETDAPDQPSHGHRGKRNEPALLVEALEVIARLRDQEPAEIAAATTANAVRLFGLPDT